MSNSIKKYSISISPPDFITYEPYEDYDKQLLQCWTDASNIFSYWEFFYENKKIIIQTDWKKIKKQFKKSIEAQAELIFSIQGEEELINGLYNYFLIRFIEMMFITMNMSVPGSLKIYDTELKSLNDPTERNLNLSLRSDPFETFWETSGKLNHWPKIDFIPLEKVVLWYKRLNIMLKQQASTNLERSIFSLINFSQNNSFSPANFLWLAHSLEALYDTPKEGIVGSLKKRLFLFLGKPDSNDKEFLKKIGVFYTFRSKFVHGEMEIAREPFFENIDLELQSYMDELIKTCDFGIMLILATIQKMILENSKELIFYENYRSINNL